jgi:beta-lactamase regulating signal transducer with metallopeptidase domain
MIALWMTYATVVGGILAAGAALVERATSGGLRQRRWIPILALALSVAVPVWTVVTPRPVIAAATPNAVNAVRDKAPSTMSLAKVSTGIAELIARADSRSLRRFDTSLAIAWVCAAVLAVAGYGVATVSLVRRRRTWRRAEVEGEPVLLAPMTGPAVIGTLRPQIVVPEWSLTLSAEQRALMIEHERQHVRAKDPLVLHAAAMVALLMPWNMAAWWLNRRLRLAIELDCDARVLARGHDPRAYGTLLVDVCARRSSGSPFLAPALFERTSSLATRILSMYPQRPRFPRARLALGAAIAIAVTLLACEAPSPEALAPDGKDVKMKRLFGEMTTAKQNLRAEQTAADVREMVTQYFPAIARGEGGPSILYLVRSSDGKIVLTQSQEAALARTPATGGENTVRFRTRVPGSVVPAEPTRTTGFALRPSRAPTTARNTEAGGSLNEVRFKTRRPGSEMLLPSGVGALLPGDIATVDIAKHAAGAVAPNAVSVITIILKPGAKVPPMAQAR